MKPLLFVVCFLATLAGKSQVVWTSGEAYDFGEIEKGIPVSTTFTFKNTSKEPVVVETVRSTCGCTAPNWSEEPVEPGQMGEIKVVYNAHKIGFFRKRIKVFFVGKRKAQKLTVLGEVVEYE